MLANQFNFEKIYILLNDIRFRKRTMQFSDMAKKYQRVEKVKI